jgi:hypothetical protein
MNWKELWEHTQGSSARMVRSIDIPQSHIVQSGDFPSRFKPREQYFSIVVNEIFATHARRWFDLVAPAAIVITEFVYGGKPIVVPYVVGPSMLDSLKKATPHGVAITDTRVAGITPFSGGSFAVTVIVAEVKVDSYATRLLDFASGVTGACPLGASIEPYLKIAGSVMRGIEKMLGLADFVPIVGHRFEYNDGLVPWLVPGFRALIDLDEMQMQGTTLSVNKGRLFRGLGEGASPFRDADYVLYSLHAQDRRTDVATLPFQDRFRTALQDAASAQPGSWERAKASLVAIHQELLASPDLVWDDLRLLLDDMKRQISQAHKDSESIQFLGPLMLPPGHATERSQRLSELHELLSLD